MKKPSLPLVWTQNSGVKYCVLLGLQNVDDEWEIKEGRSRAKGFPPDAYFEMDRQFRKQVALSDQLANLENMAVVSESLKGFIEARKPANVEFLPVHIKDHKGRNVNAAYHIMNPLSIVDCIDKQRSDIQWNNLSPELISDVLKLVLLPDKIDPELLLFRCQHLSSTIFVRRDLAEAIAAKSFTGLEFTELEEFIR